MEAANEFKMPKIEPKMLLFPILMYVARQIDFKDEKTLLFAQQCFYASVAGVLAFYFLLYQLVERRKDKREVYVPPKAAPSLPFGPQPEPPKIEDYTKTTIYDHEIALLKTALSSVGMSAAIAVVMTMKFNIHGSLVMQGIMLPVGITDLPLFWKYIMGRTVNKDGSPIYGELDNLPDQAGANSTVEEEEEDVPRVEEILDDEEPVAVKKQ